jgi:hypothetical protein
MWTTCIYLKSNKTVKQSGSSRIILLFTSALLFYPFFCSYQLLSARTAVPLNLVTLREQYNHIIVHFTPLLLPIHLQLPNVIGADRGSSEFTDNAVTPSYSGNTRFLSGHWNVHGFYKCWILTVSSLFEQFLLTYLSLTYFVWII